jgi:hypothetical protein
MLALALMTGTAHAGDYYLNVDLSSRNIDVNSLDTTKKEKDRWEFSSSNESGVLHFHYKNVSSPGKSSLFGNVEFVLSVGQMDKDSGKKVNSDSDETSILGGIKDQNKFNDKLFMMSIGKSWE